MTGELIRKTIRFERAVGTGEAQTMVQTGAMLTGGDRDIVVVSTQARPVVGVCEVIAGGVSVQGTVEFCTLYLTQEGLLRSRSAQTGFDAVVPVEGAQSGMKARVMITLSSVNGEERDGRLEISADLHMEALVLEVIERETAAEMQTDAPMAVKTVSLDTMRTAARGQVRETFTENFALENAAYTRVALCQARAIVERVEAGDGVVAVSGDVAVDSLLAGADTDSPVGWQREQIPFALEIVGDDFTPDMQIDVQARVRDLVGDVVFMADDGEEEGNLRVEYVLELTAEGSLTSSTEVIADAYPLNEEPFRAVSAQISYLQAQEETEQAETVSAVQDLPQDTTVEAVFAESAALDIVHGDYIGTEGLMHVTLLCRTAGQENMSVLEQDVPFAVEFDHIPEGAQMVCVEIGAVEAEKLSAAQVRVRAAVRMQALNVQSGQAAVLDDISFEGEPVVLPTGVVLVYPEDGESLWDVARRYRIREQALRERNPEEKAPLLIYRRLTGF